MFAKRLLALLDEGPLIGDRLGKAARLLNVRVAAVYRLILTGKLRAWRGPTGRYLLSEADVRDSLELVQVRRAESRPTVCMPSAATLRFLQERGLRCGGAT